MLLLLFSKKIFFYRAMRPYFSYRYVTEKEPVLIDMKRQRMSIGYKDYQLKLSIYK